MASFFITTGSTTVQTLATGENGFVAASGTLYSETSTPVLINGSAGLTVLGAIATSEGSSAVRTTTATTPDIDITVGTQGSITASLSAAIVLTVTESLDLRNNGLISGGVGASVQGITGFDIANVTNSGTVLGSGNALSFGNLLDRVNVVNSGTISSAASTAINYSNASGSFILGNTGTISSTGSAAISSSGQLFLTNSGQINGEVAANGGQIDNAGVITGSIRLLSTATINNAGTISGSVFGNSSGADISVLNQGYIGGNVTSLLGLDLLNLGTIAGIVSVSATNAPGTVENQGHIAGDVSFLGADDTFINAGGTVAGTINGGAGNDLFVIDRADLRIDGGIGLDTMDSTVSVRIGENVEVLNLFGATGLTGTGRNGSETINGAVGNDTILGRAGNDTLFGDEGNDFIEGGHGDDLVLISDGTDTVAGGAGIDTLTFEGINLRVTVNLATGSAFGTDVVGDVLRSAVLSGIENVVGFGFEDLITGSSVANLLQGSAGNDTIDGGAGNDTLVGGADNDLLSGGNNEDLIIGNDGRDTMTGGAQADIFVFTTLSDSAAGQADLITDFERPRDIIDLSAIDADLAVVRDQSFAFLGASAFTGAEAQVRFVQDTVNNLTVVEVRLAGAASNSMEIILTGIINLQASNFDL